MSLDGVGKTSLLVAAMRAVENNRSNTEGRLFNDPFAEKLAGPEGFAILEKAIAASGEQPVIAIRTRYIDDRINEALAQGIRQIVILAAGMDSRAYRMDFPEETQLFELDKKTVLDYKKEKLSDDKPRCHRKTICVDLREDWQSKLIEAGMDKTQQTLWLVEGLLMYLKEPDVLTLFKKISEMSVPQSVLLFDILSRSLIEAPFMANQLQFLASLGAPWQFGVNDPEKFMEQWGWKSTTTQASEVAPHRWPFPVMPKVPNAPRGFFVESRKL